MEKSFFAATLHGNESVEKRSFSWSVFSPNRGKYGPEKTLYLDTFYAVILLKVYDSFLFSQSRKTFGIIWSV